MGISIPKIKLGKFSLPTSVDNLDHNCTSSFNFGFVQPIFARILKEGDKLTFQNNAFVRFKVMNSPTLGDVRYMYFSRFIPFAHIWHPCSDFLNQFPYYSSVKNYVPTEFPSMFISDFTRYLLTYCAYDVYYSSGSHFDRFTSSSSIPTTISTICDYYNSLVKYSDNTNGGLNVGFWLENLKPSLGIDTSDSNSFIISPDGADFVIELEFDNRVWLFCFQASEDVRNIRKIMIGLGNQLNPNLKDAINILPLISFYKGYFDMFTPKFDVTWDSTQLHFFMDYISQNGIQNVNTLGSTVSVHSFRQFMYELYCALKSCYYTQDQDFVSAHISTPAHNFVNNSAPPVNSATALDQYNPVYSVNQNSQPVILSSSTLTSASIKLLNVVNRYVNKKTILGGQVDKLYRLLRGGDDPLNSDSNFIGSSVVPCMMDDIMCTSDSGNFTVGEYAGYGIGKAKGRDDRFSVSAYGIWITYACVVPDASFCQGIDQLNKAITFNQVFQDMYDALGYQITGKDAVLGSQDCVYNGVASPSESFGFIPRYTEYKCVSGGNILNGDLSLRSTRTNLLSYTLDKFITPNEFLSKPTGTPGQFDISRKPSFVPIAGTVYRYINGGSSMAGMGNFNRIFVNEGASAYNNSEFFRFFPIEDNFIVHNLFKITLVTRAKSISESFDTDGEDSSMSVQKS